jgi:hypothetical protein
MLPVFLDCPFLIAPLVFSSVYLTLYCVIFQYEMFYQLLWLFTCTSNIYPSQLIINGTIDINKTASYLDLYLDIDNEEWMAFHVYDNCNALEFPIFM